jgi:hypothetical protein
MLKRKMQQNISSAITFQDTVGIACERRGLRSTLSCSGA